MEHEVDVLVVDDDRDILTLITGVLHELGLRVVTAVDGRQGLERAREVHPRLVLSDVMMPRMNGDRLVAELRSDPATAHIPCILMSAAGKPAPTDVQLLPKPFDLTRLEDAVLTHLDRA